MSVEVSWDGPSADEPDRGNAVEITTVDELDAVLDQVAEQAAKDGVPYGVQIHDSEASGSVMIGIGHDRSFVDWLDDSGARTSAEEPDIAEWPEPIGFDLYGNWHEYEPEETRVSEEIARRAVHEYLNTRTRPTCVQWPAAS